MRQWEPSNCMYMCVCTLAKSRKGSQIKLFFLPLQVIFILFSFQRSYCVWGGVKGFFSFSFSAFFSFSLFVGFKGNYSPGPFQLSNVTKGNPASSFPYPHTRLFFQQKQSLLGGHHFTRILLHPTS